MNYTDQLKLPYLAAGQAQKHVTLNESLRALDALVQLSLKSRILSTPPSTPENGARYLIPAGATGAWEGKSGLIAAWQDGAWAYFTPQIGWRAWIEAEAQTRIFNGTTWVSEGGGTLSSFETFGINTTADTTNRLAVKSSASLFDAEGGNHRLTINKSAISDTASTLFQTNYSGRAEFGLTGSDDFQLKTSTDGIVWANVLTFDKTTGLGVVKANPTAALGIATKHYVDTKIAESASSAGGSATSGLPPGAIAHFAMNTPPSGWLKANGAAISRVTYAALFAAIGTAYGVGDGSTTFNLPDLRGEFIRGWDDGRGVDANRTMNSSQDGTWIRSIAQEWTGIDGAASAPIYGVGFSYASQDARATSVTNAQNPSGSPYNPATADDVIIAGSFQGANVVSNWIRMRPRNIALLACIKT